MKQWLAAAVGIAVGVLGGVVALADGTTRDIRQMQVNCDMRTDGKCDVRAKVIKLDGNTVVSEMWVDGLALDAETVETLKKHLQAQLPQQE